MADLGTLVPASPLNVSDDSRLLFSTDSDETLSRALGDTPASLGSMTSLSWQVEYGLQSARNNDTYELLIYIANGSTQLAGASATLADAQQVSASVTNTTDTVSGVTAFSYVNATADKATWDGASVYLVQNHTKSQASDGTGIQVDHVAITGTFVAFDVLTTTDLEVSATVSAPTLSQTHVLSTVDIESISEVSVPALGQVHGLVTGGINSAAEVSSPTLTAIVVPDSCHVNMPAGFVGYHVNMPAGFVGYHVKVL